MSSLPTHLPSLESSSGGPLRRQLQWPRILREGDGDGESKEGGSGGEGEGEGVIRKSELDVQAVESILLFNKAFLQLFPWAENFTAANEEEIEGSSIQEEEDGADDATEDEWVRDPSQSEFIGKRVCISVGEGFWEEGTVVAFLPATEDEPLALWRVRLDDQLDREGGKDRCEDLEQSEVLGAMERMEGNRVD